MKELIMCKVKTGKTALGCKSYVVLSVWNINSEYKSFSKSFSQASSAEDYMSDQFFEAVTA